MVTGHVLCEGSIGSSVTRWKPIGYLSIVVAYVIAGRLGLMLAVPPGYASAIFPPAGIAVAAMLAGGTATLPCTFIGSLLLNLWIGYAVDRHFDQLGLFAALTIAAASTLQAAVGGWALRGAIGYPAPLDRGRDLLRFLLLSPLCCLSSASLSLSGLWSLGILTPPDLARSWFAWWIGDTLGVLAVLPLVLVAVGEPRALWRSRARPVALPIVLFFSLFVLIFVHVSKWEREQSLLEFRLVSQQVVDKLRAGLDEQELFLDQLRNFLAGHTPVTGADFRGLVRDLLQRFQIIQAVAWAPLVEFSQRAAFEAAQREELPRFEIREASPDGQSRRAGERTRYFPVTYVEPMRGNEAALGFDLTSEDDRQMAVAKTINLGTVAATPPIHLVQEPGEQVGVLLLLAVPGGPNGPGVVLAVLRMGMYMDALLGPLKAMVGVELVDLDQRRPLYAGLPGHPDEAPYRQTFAFGTRQYGIAIAPTDYYLAGHRGWQSWVVLAGGMFSTSLLGALLLLATGHTRRVETLVGERTAELASANRRLRAEIEERLQAEAALRHAQRMEAIGQLTGGVAHDFNNLLAVVIGNAEMAKRRPGHHVTDLLDNILRAGERGARLTRQLLTFSRRQPLKPRAFDLKAEMPRVMDMLRASLRGNISLVLSVSDDLWPVEVDPAELEAALLNIAVNARDAMPRGGQFEIVARNRVPNDSNIADTPRLGGDYVAISLRDNGTGIAREVLSRVFDPFFTTKDVGVGTGLGLSQVYGFARQSGGHAVIESEVGVVLVLRSIFPERGNR